MANQKGAALIVVLSLLVGSLVIGLSSMQSSQVDERLAGNQKIATELTMGAETAGSAGFSNIREFLPSLLNDAGCSLDDIFLPVLNDENATESRDGFSIDWQGLSSLENLGELVCIPESGVAGITEDIGNEACDEASVECIYWYVTLEGDELSDDGDLVPVNE